MSVASYEHRSGASNCTVDERQMEPETIGKMASPGKAEKPKDDLSFSLHGCGNGPKIGTGRQAQGDCLFALTSHAEGGECNTDVVIHGSLISPSLKLQESEHQGWRHWIDKEGTPTIWVDCNSLNNNEDSPDVLYTHLLCAGMASEAAMADVEKYSHDTKDSSTFDSSDHL